MTVLDMFSAGASYAEIGAAMGWTKGQTAKAIHRARKQGAGDRVDPEKAAAFLRRFAGREITGADMRKCLDLDAPTVRGLLHRWRRAGVVMMVGQHRTGHRIWLVRQ